jgi:hypothetical protein
MATLGQVDLGPSPPEDTMPLNWTILIGNLFILIISLMGTQTCYFKSNWKWFYLMLACVFISAGCILIVLYQWVFVAGHSSIFPPPTGPL